MVAGVLGELEFEEVKAPPSQEEEYLTRSPMGKMPAIAVGDHFLSESLAIATYLERLQPEPALMPADPLEAGKVVELVCHMKLDVELVARRLLPEVLFKQPVSQETKDATRADLDKGMKAVGRIFVGAPYSAGDTLTLADFYTYYCFGLASMMAKAMFDQDLLADHANIRSVMALMAQHPSIKRVEAEKSG
jgi:glutathione S-transferase